VTSLWRCGRHCALGAPATAATPGRRVTAGSGPSGPGGSRREPGGRNPLPGLPGPAPPRRRRRRPTAALFRRREHRRPTATTATTESLRLSRDSATSRRLRRDSPAKLGKVPANLSAALAPRSHLPCLAKAGRWPSGPSLLVQVTSNVKPWAC